MTRKTRTILFSFFVFLFAVVAPLIIFYSQGYRLDFATKKIVQTGGFYFKIWPSSTDIHIDGKAMKKTDFFFGSTFWQDLIPKKYTVRIEKEGYQPWQKTLEVKEKLVTEIKDVILFPQKVDFQSVSQGVQDFWALPDKKRLILEKTNPSTDKTPIQNWRLVIYDTLKNVQSLFLDESVIGKKERAEILSITPSFDSKKIILAVNLSEKTQNFVIDMQNLPQTTTPLSLNFLSGGIGNIEFNSGNSQKLFFIYNQNLYDADLTNTKPRQLGTSKTAQTGDNQIQMPLLENIETYTQIGDNLYLLQSVPPKKRGGQISGFIYRTDTTGKIIEKINETALILKPESYYKIFVFQPYIFLQENDTLYLFNSETKSFEKFFEQFQNLKISPDSKKLAYFSDNDLWLLYLVDDQEQPIKKAGDKIFLGNFPEKIEEVFWLSSNYLILNSGNKVKIIETDDRDRVQTWDIGAFENPKIFFNDNDKKLYVLDKTNLFLAENLLK